MLSIMGLILEKFLYLGSKGTEIIYFSKYLNVDSFKLDLAFIIDEISLGFSFFILLLAVVFYVFSLINWKYFKKEFSNYNYIIFFSSIIISLLSVFSENLFIIWVLWPFIGIFNFSNASPNIVIDEKMNFKSYFNMEGFFFSLFSIAILIFLICFNGSLSFLNFNKVNLEFILKNKYILSFSIMVIISPFFYRIFLSPFNFWNSGSKKLEKFRFGFLNDILTSIVFLSLLIRLNPIFIFLPYLHLFLQVFGLFTVIVTSVFLIIEKKGPKTLLLLNSFFWGWAIFSMGLGFIGSSLYFLLGYLLLKNLLLMIDWEINYLENKENILKKQFLKGLFILTVLLIAGFPGGSTFFFKPDLFWKIFSINVEPFKGYFIFNLFWSLFIVSIFGFMINSFDKKDKIISLLLEFPKNTLKLKIRNYIFYFVLCCVIFLYFYKGLLLKSKLDILTKFSATFLSEQLIHGQDLSEGTKFYFYASFLAIFLLVSWAGYYIYSKPNKNMIDGYFKLIYIRKRIISFFGLNSIISKLLRPAILTISSIIKYSYKTIFLKFILKTPFKVSYQIGTYFNIKKSESLIDSLILAFLGIIIFLYFIFSKINNLH